MAHVILIGAGAIGSHAIPHLARMPQISRVTVVDHDRYDHSNLMTQDIGPCDLGESKALVQARSLQAINPSITATGLDCRIEDLPLGALHCDALLACLDSRRARLIVNQIAWRLGVPWINAGINATGLLARVQVFVPAPEAPCLECAWDDRDYELVEQRYPCWPASAAPPTSAPSALGALAAALQAIECQKLLSHDHDGLLAGREVLIDLQHHRHYVTTLRRNTSCRMPDHSGWHITSLIGSSPTMPFGEIVEHGRALVGAKAGVLIRVAGQRVASTLTCPHCLRTHPAWLLERVVDHQQYCPQCLIRMPATGFDLRDAASIADIPDDLLSRPISDTGLLPGDVITLTSTAAEVHLELGGVA